MPSDGDAPPASKPASKARSRSGDDPCVEDGSSERQTLPFCHPDPKNVFHTGTHLIGLWDSYLVAPGHALLVPKRHVATWFDATEEERSELLTTIELKVGRTALQNGYLRRLLLVICMHPFARKGTYVHFDTILSSRVLIWLQFIAP